MINIDKPQGMTSFDVVRRIRRAAGGRKVGHAGTLDPNATGVLPIAIGEATRLVDELVDSGKRYLAEVIFGSTTDTYDLEGTVTSASDASGVDEAAVRAALAPYQGQVMQRPPAYSAVKRDGVAAYRAARRGEPLELEERPVTVYGIEVVEFDRSNAAAPRVILDIRCGKGFYVRSLAHDVGQALGCGAHLGALRRTQVGLFVIEDATPLDTAVRLLEAGAYETLVHAPDMVLTDWPAIILGRDAATRIRQGMDVLALPREGYQRPAEDASGGSARGYDGAGELLALLQPGTVPGTWHPYRVFPPETRSQ